MEKINLSPLATHSPILCNQINVNEDEHSYVKTFAQISEDHEAVAAGDG